MLTVKWNIYPRFAYTSEEGDEIEVCFGSDGKEIFATGQSATQSPQEHFFKFCILELLRHLHKSLESNIIFAFTNSRGTFYQPGDTLPVLKKLLEENNLKIDVSPSNYFCFDNEVFRYLSFQYLNFILENTDFLNSFIYLFLIPFHTPDPK